MPDPMTTPIDELAGTPLTAESARELTEFSLYVKKARTLISDRTFPPGTTYQTPEGLRAEDEETRVAFDVQGGIYPIRESVFRASYAPGSTPVPASNVSEGLREALDALAAEFPVEDVSPAPWVIEKGTVTWMVREGSGGPQIGNFILEADARFVAAARAALAHAAPEGLDVERLAEAMWQADDEWRFDSRDKAREFAVLVARRLLATLDAARSIPAGLDVDRLRRAIDNVNEMDPLDYLDEGDNVDAIAAEYARLRSKEPTDAR